MSSPQFAAVPASFQSAGCSFNVNGPLAKVVVEPMLAAAESATTPRFYGGCSLLDLIASSTDANARDIILWQADILTTQGAGTTGTVTASAVSLTRVSGDWLADGWKLGDIVSAYVPPSAATDGNEGKFGAVNAITSTVLSFTVIGNAWTAAALTAGSRICRMKQLFKAQIPVNAGNTNAIPNVSLLGNAMDASLLRAERKLGTTEMLVAQLPVAPGALPITIGLAAQIARY